MGALRSIEHAGVSPPGSVPWRKKLGEWIKPLLYFWWVLHGSKYAGGDGGGGSNCFFFRELLYYSNERVDIALYAPVSDVEITLMPQPTGGGGGCCITFRSVIAVSLSEV